MKCADPILCYTNSKGNKRYRNFSFVKKNTLYLQIAQQVFDCGKCIHCRKKRASELAMRCVLHSSLYRQNCFLTLTYDETKEGYNNEFNYVHIQRFKKRIRQAVQRSTGRKIQIFNVHEYGKNGKSHWHLVVFNYYPEDAKFFTQRNRIPYYTSETLKRLWPYGNHTIGDVNEASAMYQAQYMEKDFKNYNSHSKKKAHSKHSGIGKDYFLRHYKQILSLGYVPFNGLRVPIPRYYEKLAKKHWCHFNQKSAFFDTNTRKKLFTPFKQGEENKEIADLYETYLKVKQEKILDLEKEFSNVISQYLTTGRDPDFIYSAQNTLHNLRNKEKEEKF